VATFGDGTGVVVWGQANSAVKAAVVSQSGVAPPATVSDAQSSCAFSNNQANLVGGHRLLGVAADANGNFVVGWPGLAAAQPAKAFVRRVVAGSPVEAPQGLATGVESVDVGALPCGGYAVAWTDKPAVGGPSAWVRFALPL
jgi:hypothetical protein